MKWISVEDQLPEEGSCVLTYSSIDNIWIDHIEAGIWYSNAVWNWIEGDEQKQLPTHWQPLPDPPDQEAGI